MNNGRVTPGSSVIPHRRSGVRLKPAQSQAGERETDPGKWCVWFSSLLDAVGLFKGLMS